MSNDIPDTDLVRIAERDVIERAKDWAADRRNWAMANGRLEDNLLAAVALLESRENLVRVEGETK